MASPAIDRHEAQRLQALQEYGVDTPLQDAGLGRLMQLTASIFHVPVALVSLVDQARQLFAAGYGTEICETDRSVSFCAHALGGTDILMVPDALQDPRFAGNPLVLGAPFIRFYAGCPLRSRTGFVLGTLCIIDVRPRASLNEEEQASFRDLAGLVMDKLELRRLDLAWQSSQTRFEKMAEVSPDAIVCVDEQARITFWNPAAERLFGHDRADVLGRPLAAFLNGEGAQRLLALAADDSPLSSGHTGDLVIRSAAGGLVPVEMSASMWREQGRASFCAVLRDVTERRRNEERLRRLAHIDALTDLPNRTLFRERVEADLGRRQSGCLMMIDLDGFKDVNDGYGHAAGDSMLVVAARRLSAALREQDTVARMGGDEFALFLPGVEDHAHIAATAEAIIESLSQSVMLEGEPVTIGASVGIALVPRDGRTIRELLSAADLALYDAKANGKHCFRFFAAEMRDAATAKQAYLSELPRALVEGEWLLYYQPIVRLADKVVVAAEAQLRWQHPTHGLLAPSAFMHALRSSPASARIGNWMLNSACAQLAEWRAHLPELRMCVNALDAQFRSGDLADRVEHCLSQHGLPGAALELEISETILLRQDLQTGRMLESLLRRGVSLALVNYGTGHAALDLLKRVPLSRLKIDPSFVQGMETSKVDAAIIRVMLYLGRNLDLVVTAEGVETAAQAERLRKKGCEEALGAWFSDAVPAASFFELVRAQGASG